MLLNDLGRWKEEGGFEGESEGGFNCRRRGELLTAHVASRPFLLRDYHFVVPLAVYIFRKSLHPRRPPARIVIILAKGGVPL